MRWGVAGFFWQKKHKNFASLKKGCIFAADLDAQKWIVDALFALGFKRLNEKKNNNSYGKEK